MVKPSFLMHGILLQPNGSALRRLECVQHFPGKFPSHKYSTINNATWIS